MFYAITVDDSGNITSHYKGPVALTAPWVTITRAQYATIVPGSTWSGSGVVSSPVKTFTAQEQLAQQAKALIAGGITITSAATPALNGKYATDSSAQAKMLGIVSYINANSAFPGSSETLTWYDMSGQPHVFSSTAEFLALYTASLDFVIDCQMVADAGIGMLPAGTAFIP